MVFGNVWMLCVIKLSLKSYGIMVRLLGKFGIKEYV
jgi:hypothetical protein